MTAIAILGANSQIAADFILAAHTHYPLTLFSRRPEAVADWFQKAAGTACTSLAYEAFAGGEYDAIINFVGVGDPARAASMGVAILDITRQYDDLALENLRRHPQTRYIFLSSGAAYGAGFAEPAGEDTPARIALNHLLPQHYYSVAKLYAEARHRALAPMAITNVRVFSYFSRGADLSSRFFLTDLVRAIRDCVPFETMAESMVRDYLIPPDFFTLVAAILRAPAANAAFDAYSGAPVEKFTLLDAMRDEFGLSYRTSPLPIGVNATGVKSNYYSTYRRAADLGYTPRFTSLEGVMREARALLGR